MPTRTLPLDPPSRALVDALIAMSTDLDLPATLHRITRSACTLTHAAYGALVLLEEDDTAGGVITHGLAPEEESPVHSVLRTPVRAAGRVFGNLYLSAKPDGADFTDEDENLVLVLARAAGSVIDNARAYALSERRRRWLEAATELIEALEPPVDHETALHRICATVCCLARARAVAIVTHDGQGPVAALASAPADEELALRAAMALHPLLPPDAQSTSEQETEGLYAVVVPFRSALSGNGGICVLYDDASDLGDSDDEDLLTRFADQVALALDRVHAVETRADLAVVSDRERIARELHDVVIQRIFATGLQLEALGQAAAEPQMQERLAAAVEALDLTIRGIRSTVFELQRPAESTLGSTTGSPVSTS